jgi:hypothetical protein
MIERLSSPVYMNRAEVCSIICVKPPPDGGYDTLLLIARPGSPTPRRLPFSSLRQLILLPQKILLNV